MPGCLRPGVQTWLAGEEKRRRAGASYFLPGKMAGCQVAAALIFQNRLL